MKHLSRDAVNAKLKAEAEAFAASGRAVKMISLIVLQEEFGFTAQQLRTYLDRFDDVLDYYNTSKDYQSLLHEWDDYFEQELGEKILWKTEQRTK